MRCKRDRYLSLFLRVMAKGALLAAHQGDGRPRWGLAARFLARSLRGEPNGLLGAARVA
jgi:hypothetical protein